MIPTRRVESGKTSPIARPSPSKALKVASLLSKCKSQSVIESRKPNVSSATNARGKTTRHQSVLSVRTAQHGLASPTEDLNHARANACADKYISNPGDHSPKASNMMETKLNSRATSEWGVGHDSETSATVAVPETVKQLSSDSREPQGDKNPSTSSLEAMVQVAKHRPGNPHDSINWSRSSNGLDTTWPSWSSDASYKGAKDGKRYTMGQPKTLRRNTTSLNEKFKVLAKLAIKRQSSSPTKAPLPRKMPATGNSPKMMKKSSNIGVNNFKSLTSTTIAPKVDCPAFSRSMSPVKTGCKITLSQQLQKKDEISLSPTDSWDSLSPLYNCRRKLSSSSVRNALPHSAFKHIDICDAKRSGSPNMTKVSTSTVVPVCRQRVTTKNTPMLKRKLSFSPSVMENVKTAKTQEIKINRSLRNNSSIGPRTSSNLHLLKLNKPNRGDRSTDSGYQESLSRATLDWFNTLGLIPGERSSLKRPTDPTADVASRFDPPTNFSNGSPLSAQTALYSIDEHNRSCHSPALPQYVHSEGDGNLDTSTTQRTDEELLLINQQNKSRCHFVGEVQNVSTRCPQSSEIVGNSDQTLEQISESALTVEIVEDEVKYPKADIAAGAQQEVHSVVADTFCISDTCGLVSEIEILDNNSDVTDISADWDVGPSCQESSPGALISSKNERFAKRDAHQHKEPKSPKNHSLHKSYSPSSKDRKTKKEVSHFELGASPETSIRDESSVQELSYTSAFLARGFNSNTRRTVEINYDLIAMSDATTRVLNGNTPTFSDGPGSGSLSEPSRSPGATQLPIDKGTPNDLRVDDDVVADSRLSTSRSRLRLLTLSRALDHCYWSNMTSAMNRDLASYWFPDIPEPKLFYIGCLFIMIMCMVLAFIFTYSIIG